MTNPLSPPPVNERMLSDPGMISRVWLRFFESLRTGSQDQLDALYIEVAMMVADSQAVRDLAVRVKDIEMKLDMLSGNEQEIRENKKRILDTDTLVSMGE